MGTPVVATDDDNDTPTYTLGGTDGGFFTIVGTSGQIQTKSGQNYDFETKPTYSVTVTADDSNGGMADKAVTITLANVDEDGTVTLPPTQPVARLDVTAILADPDNGVTNVSWQWSKSDSQNGTYANISSATSATYTPADEDVGKFLKATASYTDDEGSGKNAEKSTTSAVQSGTNRAPTFDDGLLTTRDVDEGTAEDQPVGSPVTASDLDDDALTYSLTGTDATSFTVDSTGQIKVGATTTLDYEAVKDSYTVIVRVQDNRDALGEYGHKCRCHHSSDHQRYRRERSTGVRRHDCHSQHRRKLGGECQRRRHYNGHRPGRRRHPYLLPERHGCKLIHH